MLSKKAKYGINALIYLAHRKDKDPVPIHQIAESESIPSKFLESILLELKKAGILGSKKGPGGGYYLIKELQEVNLAEVMRLYDGPIALLPCVTYKYYERCEECKDEETCGIRDVFLQLRNETVELLKNSTLEDILLREGKLQHGVSEPDK
jgi:Rrf2 family protein